MNLTQHTKTDFTKSKTFQIIKERWTGKDMEQYFIDRNKEFITRLTYFTSSQRKAKK